MDGMAHSEKNVNVNSEKVRVPKIRGHVDEWLVARKNGDKSGPSDKIDCDDSIEWALPSELVENGMSTPGCYFNSDFLRETVIYKKFPARDTIVFTIAPTHFI